MEHANLSFFKTFIKKDGGHCNQFPKSILLLSWQASKLAAIINTSSHPILATLIKRALNISDFLPKCHKEKEKSTSIITF